MQGSWRTAALLVAASMATVAVAAVPHAPTEQQASVQVPTGALYLTAAALPTSGDVSCPGGTPRYEMRANLSGVAAGVAAAAWSLPDQVSCPTRFLLEPELGLQVIGDVDVVLWVRCNVQTVHTGLLSTAFRVELSNDPNERGPNSPLNPPTVNAPPEPTPCGATPVEVRRSLRGQDLHVAPGGKLVLLVRPFFLSPPAGTVPTIEFLVGPETPSRLENVTFIPGLTAGEVDPRPRLSLSSEMTNNRQFLVACSPDMPAYALRPPTEPVASGAAALEASTGAGVGCATWFEFTAEQPFVLEGPLAVNLWFQCTSTTYGSPSSFILRFRHVDPLGAETDVADQASTGPLVSPEECPLSPVRAPQASTAIRGAVQFVPGDRLRLEITPNYVNPPSRASSASSVQVLVGPDYPSALHVAGLPWPAAAGPSDLSGPGPVAGGAKGSPGAGIVLLTTALGALAVACRRKAAR